MTKMLMTRGEECRDQGVGWSAVILPDEEWSPGKDSPLPILHGSCRAALAGTAKSENSTILLRCCETARESALGCDSTPGILVCREITDPPPETSLGLDQDHHTVQSPQFPCDMPAKHPGVEGWASCCYCGPLAARFHPSRAQEERPDCRRGIPHLPDRACDVPRIPPRIASTVAEAAGGGGSSVVFVDVEVAVVVVVVVSAVDKKPRPLDCCEVPRPGRGPRRDTTRRTTTTETVGRGQRVGWLRRWSVAMWSLHSATPCAGDEHLPGHLGQISQTPAWGRRSGRGWRVDAGCVAPLPDWGPDDAGRRSRPWELIAVPGLLTLPLRDCWPQNCAQNPPHSRRC